jgi:hypothetical protein
MATGRETSQRWRLKRNKKESRGKDLKEKRLSEAVEKEDIS